MELYGRGEGNDQTGILTNMKLEKDEQIARLFLAFSHWLFREFKEFKESLISLNSLISLISKKFRIYETL